jgi:hypothetical protein
MALALPLAVADFRPLHTTAGRGRVAHRRQAAHMACFQHDRLGYHRPTAIDGQQRLGGGGVVQRLTDGLCQDGALLTQTMQQRQAAGDR